MLRSLQTPPAPVATASTAQGRKHPVFRIAWTAKRMGRPQIEQMIAHGSGRMPDFEGSLSKDQIRRPDELHQ